MGSVSMFGFGNISHSRMGSIPTSFWLLVMLPLPTLIVLIGQSERVLMWFGVYDDHAYFTKVDTRKHIAMRILLAGAAGLLFAALERLILYLQRTPMQARLREWERHLRVTNPKPKACERGAGRAVSIGNIKALLEAFQGNIRDRTAYYLAPNIILPLTRKRELSYSELVGPARLVYFVSHFWGTPFAHFVAALENHAQTTGKQDWQSLAYWVCFLSNNQYKIPVEVGDGDWKESSFYKALRSGYCAATCMVLDGKAMPLTRSWCLFEVLQTYSLQGDRNSAFEGLRFCTRGGVLGDKKCSSYDVVMSLGQRIASLDLASATATDPDDEKMIKGLVEQEGGINKMNKFIRGKMTDDLKRAQENFTQRTVEINRELAELPGEDQQPGLMSVLQQFGDYFDTLRPGWASPPRSGDGSGANTPPPGAEDVKGMPRDSSQPGTGVIHTALTWIGQHTKTKDGSEFGGSDVRGV